MAEDIYNFKDEDRDIDIDIVSNEDQGIIRIVIFYPKKIGLAMGMEEFSDLLYDYGPWIVFQSQDKQRGNYTSFEFQWDEDDEEGVHETRTEWPQLRTWPIHDRGGASSPTIRRRPR